MLHTVFIFPLPDSRYLISHESPPGHPAPLQTFLPPFRLRSKVRIRDVSDQWECWSAWGSEDGAGPIRNWRMGSGGAAESVWRFDDEQGYPGLGEGEVACLDLRAGFGNGGMGRQILVPRGKPRTPRPSTSWPLTSSGIDSASLTSSHDPASTEDYHLHRMLIGVPEGPSEIAPGSALPLESCMDVQAGGRSHCPFPTLIF